MKQFLIGILSVWSCLSVTAGDIDTRIAVNSNTNDQTFAVIISNENYKYEQAVPFANNDGRMFKLYCQKTLGLPEDNIRYVSDATLNDMTYAFDWLEDVMTAFQGTGRAIVYYSGHGMPDEDSKSAYLLPIDGYSTSVRSGLSTKDLYQRLSAMPSQMTIVFLDACFSGAGRNGNMMDESRGVAVLVKKPVISGNLLVFSAAQGNETAYPYTDEEHGLFTYYLLDKLRESRGVATLGELSDYVIDNVRKKSIVKNSKSQSPMITASATCPNWRSWKLVAQPAKNIEVVDKPNEIRQPVRQESISQAAPVVQTPPPDDSTIRAMIENGLKAMRSFNYDKAYSCFKSAVDMGSVEGYYQLGILYADSNYMGYNKETAREYLGRAAMNNHAQAAHQCGLLWIGVDNAKARYCFRRAIALGVGDSQKYFNQLGRGPEVNPWTGY